MDCQKLVDLEVYVNYQPMAANIYKQFSFQDNSILTGMCLNDGFFKFMYHYKKMEPLSERTLNLPLYTFQGSKYSCMHPPNRGETQAHIQFETTDNSKNFY
jgi:hypothetical protein